MELTERPRLQMTGRLAFGVLVVLVGVVFLLDELEVAAAGELMRYLPALPLLIGLMFLTGVGLRRNIVGGVLITFFSGWFLLRSLGVFSASPWGLWPVVMLVVGGWIVVSALRGPATPATLEEGGSTLQAFAFWSGSTRKISSQDFRGGFVTAIMGGHEIDLRKAGTGDGAAVIDLFVWWGGVEIRVPEDWAVSNETLPLLAGVEDSSKGPEGEVKGRLILKGLIIMGGVEVKN